MRLITFCRDWDLGCWRDFSRKSVGWVLRSRECANIGHLCVGRVLGLLWGPWHLPVIDFFGAGDSARRVLDSFLPGLHRGDEGDARIDCVCLHANEERALGATDERARPARWRS